MANANFLSKENQLKLREAYAVALNEIFKGGMQNYILNNIAYFVPVNNGKGIATIRKEDIKKDFWCGYSDCGQGQSYDECNEQVDSIRKNLEQAFMSENLEGREKRAMNLEYLICTDNKILDSSECRYVCYIAPNYTSSPADCLVVNMNFVHWYDEIEGRLRVNNPIKATREDLENYLLAYNQYTEDFTKRLKTYFKRFRDKISVHTYWIDR